MDKTTAAPLRTQATKSTTYPQPQSYEDIGRVAENDLASPASSLGKKHRLRRSQSVHDLPAPKDLLQVPSELRRRETRKTQERLQFASPATLLTEGTVIFVARPPHPYSLLGCRRDSDVEVLFDQTCFMRRLQEMQNIDIAAPSACKAQAPPIKKHWNQRQKKCRTIVGDKCESASLLWSAFNLEHTPLENVLPEVRAIHGQLRDYVHNKSLDMLVDENSEEEEGGGRTLAVMQLVFEHVANFLVKHTNRPHGDVAKLCEDVRKHKERYAQMLLDWVGATEQKLPGLASKCGHGSQRMAIYTLGTAFSSILSSVAATVQPERRVHLRQSFHSMPCWRIKIPDVLAGKYLGHARTINKTSDRIIDCSICEDAATVYGIMPLILQKENGHWEHITSTTRMPANGHLYTVCKLCMNVSNVHKNCNCKDWLLEYLRTHEQVGHHMTRAQIDMDEMIVPDHSQYMVIGAPSHKDKEEEGALNLRQFTFGKINAVTAAFVTERKPKS